MVQPPATASIHLRQGIQNSIKKGGQPSRRTHRSYREDRPLWPHPSTGSADLLHNAAVAAVHDGEILHPVQGFTGTEGGRGGEGGKGCRGTQLRGSGDPLLPDVFFCQKNFNRSKELWGDGGGGGSSPSLWVGGGGECVRGRPLFPHGAFFGYL